MPSGRGNPSIHVILRGFPLKFRFCNGPYMVACFYEHLTWELWKLVHWVKNDADSKYDSQIAVRAIPDYEPYFKARLAKHIMRHTRTT